MRTRLAHGGLIAAMLFGAVSTPAAESDKAEIDKTYRAWVLAANAKDIGDWAVFLSPGAYFSPPDSPPLTTRKEILDYYQNAFSDPAFSLDCEQQEVHVAISGEMAWSRGICHATFTNKRGETASGQSRWFKVWSKQPDGSWKGRINTWKYDD